MRWPPQASILTRTAPAPAELTPVSCRASATTAPAISATAGARPYTRRRRCPATDGVTGRLASVSAAMTLSSAASRPLLATVPTAASNPMPLHALLAVQPWRVCHRSVADKGKALRQSGVFDRCCGDRIAGGWGELDAQPGGASRVGAGPVAAASCSPSAEARLTLAPAEGPPPARKPLSTCH